MGAARTLGIVLLVLSIPVLLAAVVSYGSEGTMPAIFGPSTGIVLAAAGVGLLLFGIVFIVVAPKKKVVAAPVAPPPPPPQVEIKRTEMNWGANKPKSASDELQEELEAVNQQIGKIKVQYGIGELSNEAYKLMMADYEKKKSKIEKKIIEQGQK